MCLYSVRYCLIIIICESFTSTEKWLSSCFPFLFSRGNRSNPFYDSRHPVCAYARINAQLHRIFTRNAVEDLSENLNANSTNPKLDTLLSHHFKTINKFFVSNLGTHKWLRERERERNVQLSPNSSEYHVIVMRPLHVCRIASLESTDINMYASLYESFGTVTTHSQWRTHQDRTSTRRRALPKIPKNYVISIL